MSSQPKVLFVLTSYGKIEKSGSPTGWYLPELAHPYEVLAPHVQITVASPAGGEAPLDPASVEASKDDEVSLNFKKNNEKVWKTTEKLDSFLGRAKEFDAIFFVGGHGPMFDLATDSTSHKLINEFNSSSKVISAVCHGPAALGHVKTPSGTYLLADHAVTGFSNTEEEQAGMVANMPFSLEDQLNTVSGGKFEKAAEAWGAKVVVSGRIITGQNPASAKGVGEAILKAIGGGK